MLRIWDANNFRRTLVGLCLIGGPLLALIGALLSPPTQNGTTAAYLEAFAENPVQTQVSAVLLYFGNLLIAVSIFGIIHLLRHRAVVLAHVAGVLAVWGWLTLPGRLVADFYDLSLAQASNREEAITISERASSYAGYIVMDVPELLGLLGLLLLGVALWRAGFAPPWVPIVLLLGLAIGLAIGVSALFGGLLVGLGYLGVKVLRMTNDEWERGT